MIEFHGSFLFPASLHVSPELAYGLCVFLTLMMVFRQFMRAVAITNFYGFKSMAVACLLPPLMPIRLIWGNIINLTATIKVWKPWAAKRPDPRTEEHNR